MAIKQSRGKGKEDEKEILTPTAPQPTPPNAKKLKRGYDKNGIVCWVEDD